LHHPSTRAGSVSDGGGGGGGKNPNKSALLLNLLERLPDVSARGHGAEKVFPLCMRAPPDRLAARSSQKNVLFSITKSISLAAANYLQFGPPARA